MAAGTVRLKASAVLKLPLSPKLRDSAPDNTERTTDRPFFLFTRSIIGCCFVHSAPLNQNWVSVSMLEDQTNTRLFLVFLFNDPVLGTKTNAWFSCILWAGKQQTFLYLLRLAFCAWTLCGALWPRRQSKTLRYGQTGVVSKFHPAKAAPVLILACWCCSWPHIFPWKTKPCVMPRISKALSRATFWATVDTWTNCIPATFQANLLFM